MKLGQRLALAEHPAVRQPLCWPNLESGRACTLITSTFLRIMVTPITKARIVQAVEELPEDASLEDALERLLFLHKIEVGLRQVESGDVVSLDEVEARLRKRRAARGG